MSDRYPTRTTNPSIQERREQLYVMGRVQVIYLLGLFQRGQSYGGKNMSDLVELLLKYEYKNQYSSPQEG